MKSNSNESYEQQLNNLLQQNEVVWNALQLAEKISLPNWYIGAGCIAQTVWNHFHGFPLDQKISDIDFVYFDKSDLSYEKENEIIQIVKSEFSSLTIPVDVKNQARVHLWYKDHFGYDIKPYSSVEDAIRTWPTTATSVGVRLESGKLQLFAPFGLNDLFNLVVRANKKQITQEIYMSKVNKWKAHWLNLKVIEW